MNHQTIQQKIDEAEPIWNCKVGQWDEVGCPHKDWTKEELWEALITKKKFEASKLAGEILTK